jgi:hypothetical protein
MRLIPDTNGKRNPTFLSSTQQIHLLALHISGDSENAQMPPIDLFIHVGEQSFQLIIRSQKQVQGVQMVLGESGHSATGGEVRLSGG